MSVQHCLLFLLLFTLFHASSAFPFMAVNTLFWLFQEISLSGGRFQSCLREIRARATDVENKEKGIKISKKDWEKLHVHISSFNNFPTAAGLASSAAGLACLGNRSFSLFPSSLYCNFVGWSVYSAHSVDNWTMPISSTLSIWCFFPLIPISSEH